jgi:hypothetical protein
MMKRIKTEAEIKQRIKWSPGLAYVVGLLTTDGSLSIDKRHIILISKDIQLLKTFRKILKLKNKITLKRSGYTGKKNCYHLQFGNVVFYHWLLGIGLTPNKSKTLSKLKVPDKYFFDFLRGFLMETEIAIVIGIKDGLIVLCFIQVLIQKVYRFLNG